ncbi:MAG: hypothetical protein EPO68_15155 [Planctomycetota bacterium]|nr:MAG: hypothetical protein EPO68_15155 [Planctomycetota bacterium]
MNKLIIALALATVSLTACKSDDKMAAGDAKEPAAKPECCEMKAGCDAKAACDTTKAGCDATKTCPVTGKTMQ